MNSAKEQLTNKIVALRVELRAAGNDDRHYIENEIDYLTDDLHCEFAKDCIAEGEHFRMTISDGGYDVCFNCGARS
jgi:hypothetical protein